ncbi:hypothetical protein [Alkalitalea saponilacus]|uniref:Uncharacterized protein n=1 Tax=Alkalitalea saponilacus TaxID=889453 RepID=A0A1T5H7Z1_9BACT|nr:hypothetical protein [Alkalitalea saponilacus]ASB50849.1 hypothetical protein CDL62_17670 [Alkalitalea saponilacus]SKC16825.1 hypothetical protein SAMN03080601_02126 [Alkalitalea saponilacus]
MASVRNLKKDINFLASELVTQAYLSKVIFKKINDEELDQLISDALNFKTEFIARVNHPDGKDNPKLVKSYFYNVRKDMVTKFGQLLDKASVFPPDEK